MSDWQHIGVLVAPILSTLESTRNAAQNVEYDREMCQKKSEGPGASNTPTPLEHNQPIKEVGAMSRCGQYRDSIANFNQNKEEHAGRS